MTILNLCVCTLQQRTVAHAGFVCRLLRFQFLFLSSFYFANFIIFTNFYTVYVSILSSSIHVLPYVLFILQCTYFVKDECEIIIVYESFHQKSLAKIQCFNLNIYIESLGRSSAISPCCMHAGLFHSWGCISNLSLLRLWYVMWLILYLIMCLCRK